MGAAAAVAATGLLIVEAVSLTAWIAEPRSAAPLTDALRTGAAFWLLGHGGRLNLPAGTAALIPLGLSILFALLAARAGAAVARVRPAGPRRRVLLASTVAVSIPYALIAGGVAKIAHGGGLVPSVVTAVVGAGVLSAAGAFLGAVRELPPAYPKRSRWQAVAAGVGAAGALLLAVSALVAGIALVTHLSDAAALARPAKAGAVGGFGLLVLQAALAPNAVAWSASYLLGPGFAVGAGTMVSPTGVHLGDVPGLPMLAGLPSSAVPWPVYALFLVPPAAGVLGGIVMVRRLPHPPKLAVAVMLSAAMALVIGLLAAALATLSGGPATGGRLATIGPSPLRTAVAAVLEIGLASMVGAAALTLYRQRRRRRAAVPVTLAERVRRLPALTGAAAAATGRALAGPFRPRDPKPADAAEPVEPETAPAAKATQAAPTFDSADTTDLTETLALLLESPPDAASPALIPEQAEVLVDLEKHPVPAAPAERRMRVPARLRRKPKVSKLPP